MQTIEPWMFILKLSCTDILSHFSGISSQKWDVIKPPPVYIGVLLSVLGYVCRMGNLLYVHKVRIEGVAPLSINISIGVTFINLVVNIPLSLYSIV